MLPKKGKRFPRQPYVGSIAETLNQQLGQTHQAVKTLRRWTGAGERTVKNWLAGRCGPSGPHLVALIRHSDAALETLLRLAGRPEFAATNSLLALRDEFAATLKRIDILIGERPIPQRRG